MHDFRFSESEIFGHVKPDSAIGLMRLTKFACQRTHQLAFSATANDACGTKSRKLICPSGKSKIARDSY
jgi:hypothetical protein